MCGRQGVSSLCKYAEIERHPTLSRSGNLKRGTGHEFLDVVTHPKIYDLPTPLSTALAAVEAWQASPSLRLLGEGAGYWEVISAQATAGKIKGPKIHDARIAAICIHHRVKKFWTADRDFSSFPKIACENPLVRRGK